MVQMFGWLSAEAARASRCEPLDGGGIAGSVGGQELQRHLAAEARVLGPVDDPHASAAEEIEDPVMGDGGPDHLLMMGPNALTCSSITFRSPTMTIDRALVLQVLLRHLRSPAAA